MRENILAKIMALPTACSARNTINISPEVETAHKKDPMVNIMIP
jgi:hypothetical protein